MTLNKQYISDLRHKLNTDIEPLASLIGTKLQLHYLNIWANLLIVGIEET